MAEVTSTQWIHSCDNRNAPVHTVIVKEKDVTIDDTTGKVIRDKSNLRMIMRPKKKVYITKPQFRNHTYKKESEEISKCDMYTIEDFYLREELAKILGIQKKRFASLKEICSSPYVYCADLNIESLIRISYENNQKHVATPLHIGFFDIEQSVLEDKRINAISMVHKDKTRPSTKDTVYGVVYCAVLKDFMKKEMNGYMDKAYVSDIINRCYELLGEKTDDGRLRLTYTDGKSKKTKYFEFTLIIEEFEQEIDLIKWSIDNIHKEDLDFVGIWNLAFDIPTIINRIKANGVKPEDIFCDPSIPNDYRRCEYIEDKKVVAHVIEKWPWFECTSLTQWLCSMTIFARLRKRETKRPSYSLSAIAKDIVNDDKLDFVEGGHLEMQTKHFVDYAVYNIKDSLLLFIMDDKNNDITNYYNQCGHTRLKDFSAQMHMLNNSYHLNLLEKGYVLASAGDNDSMHGPYDSYITKVGGAVVNAHNVRDISIACVKELPNILVNLVPYVCDQDFASLYPNIKISGGICKENKVATLLMIEGFTEQINNELYCSSVASPQENAVYLCNRYYGLPGYTEIEKYFNE